MQKDIENKKSIFINKIKLFLLSILSIFIILFTVAYFTSHHYQRSSSALIDQYYRLKTRDPKAAKRTLDLLLHQDPENTLALKELTYWSLGHHDKAKAIELLKTAHQLEPNNTHTAFELASLLWETQAISEAKPLFTFVSQYGKGLEQVKADIILDQMQHASALSTTKQDAFDSLLNKSWQFMVFNMIKTVFIPNRSNIWQYPLLQTYFNAFLNNPGNFQRLPFSPLFFS